jgi:flavin-dependent dehydrogenase
MTTDSEPHQRVDVCIIGAGPAGSALAIRMAQLGYKVCVIERAVFPRPHIGESLSPGVWPQFEMLGAARAIADAGFRPCRAALVKWESDIAVRRDFGAGAGLLVDRARFDTLLLECARAHGVRVIQPAALRAQRHCADGWDLDVETAEGKRTIRASFLADASGRSAGARNRAQFTAHRTLALYGYWRGIGLPQEPRIEAGPAAWYWGVPLPDGTYNAIVFVDATEFRAQRASLTAAYNALLLQSGLVLECRDAVLSGPVRVADATPYLDRDSIALHRIKVGEAALALDPLSSSGVQKAINTALTAAVVVNTILRDPSRAEAAGAFYRKNLAETSEQHRRWAAQHYAAAATVNPGRFWHSRADGAEAEAVPMISSIDADWTSQTDLPVTLSPEAMLAEEPCIVGDVIALKTALSHPSLERPVAFLGGFELAALLQPLRAGMALSDLMETWQIPARSKFAIAKWLLDRHILRPHHLLNASENKQPGNVLIPKATHQHQGDYHEAP